MVMLYRDPNGEKIFSDNEERAKQVTSMILEVTPLGENEIDNLKTKIKHLEDAVIEYKVGNAIWLHEHFPTDQFTQLIVITDSLNNDCRE